MKSKWTPNRPIEPRHQEAPIRVQEPMIEIRKRDDTATASAEQFYRRHRRMTCPGCGCRMLKGGGGQAVVCRATDVNVAYLRCRSCGHKWKSLIEMI